ncbi:helix-turn-helix domain-containing protein [Allomuricauda sp. NBRC 101325]|uniref:helix-turn-helix domain-containing protein n=1 Tax=Allomuricauda sp. NBRC 101325 TaxID=1113758 RepID=UPI0024A06670|nr:helix-turn-helix domain-containing protein [Muricauda sp. NBRC 101325]GLU45372.1 AraC family transcriptional regulator [Muricauda sp. NBRC 101325]
MSTVINLETVNDYCNRFNQNSQHPLVSVLDLHQLKRKSQKGIEALCFNFYGVFLKQNQDCILKYGRKYYDFQEGTLVFIGPGQVVEIENGDDYVPSGYALLFHEDILHNTNLAQIISNYSFFSYEVSEALHLSSKERQIVIDSFEKIHFELEREIDQHSKDLIVANIDLFLKYCKRFYNRQFITRDNTNDSVVNLFKKSLNEYFHNGNSRELGYPTVSYFANEQSLSANYFGDLIKKQTGTTAMAMIQLKLIEVSKILIKDESKSISEIAYELGFKHPQHFSRLFKSKEGYSPNNYRLINL